ncbi:DUF6461 domain-containing protein [Streptosporangium roseum]|uniref:DUF6461 domain-containing protein n=1 Tax=Streptosporangium roseum TaxID=2001 RepID=UPI00331DA0FB
MIATAADYVWSYEGFPGLWEAYCFTLVEGLRPEDVVARLDARTKEVIAMRVASDRPGAVGSERVGQAVGWRSGPSPG